MTHVVLAEMTASISELKKNPMGTVAAGEGAAVVILTATNRPFIAFPPAPMKRCWTGLKMLN